jgi:hypothetical protein
MLFTYRIGKLRITLWNHKQWHFVFKTPEFIVVKYQLDLGYISFGWLRRKDD